MLDRSAPPHREDAFAHGHFVSLPLAIACVLVCNLTSATEEAGGPRRLPRRRGTTEVSGLSQ